MQFHQSRIRPIIAESVPAQTYHVKHAAATPVKADESELGVALGAVLGVVGAVDLVEVNLFNGAPEAV